MTDSIYHKGLISKSAILPQANTCVPSLHKQTTEINKIIHMN